MMQFRIFNSLTRKKENFEPLEPGKVKIYTCGVTVYDRCHLGHARGAVNFDVFRSLLKALRYQVTYVKNYTDIDDKIINRAGELKISIGDLTSEMIKRHDKDMASLGIQPPDIAPKATDHIPEIISMIEKLIKNGFAYQTTDGVFFSLRKFSEYGKLSGKNIDDLQAGARVEINEKKEDALDFALWKASKPGEPTLDSPWGGGRPGWHIECSAMSCKYLGETFDIHAGGSDLIFPHHENEIAQSECAHHKPFARYWLHNGMMIIDSQKMSKSLGNFAAIEDLVQKFHPELIRYFIISTQYRQSLNFSDALLAQSVEGLDRMYGALEKFESRFPESPQNKPDVSDQSLEDFKTSFFNALKDDLNTPQAIGILFDITKALNSEIQQERAQILRDVLLELAGILGILQIQPDQWFKADRIKKSDSSVTNSQIDEWVEARIQARTNKDWALADQIRNKLDEQGILLEDREGKTYWKRK